MRTLRQSGITQTAVRQKIQPPNHVRNMRSSDLLAVAPNLRSANEAITVQPPRIHDNGARISSETENAM